MRKVALLVQPAFDRPTNIQYRFFMKILEDAVRVAKANNVRVYLLRRNVSEETFKEAVRRYNPRFIYIGSHGTGSAITVRNETLILAGANDDLLRGRIIYAFNCQSFTTLAKTSKAQAFLGYSRDFVFIDKEPYLSKFMYLGFLPLRLILEGKRAKEAYEYTKSEYRSIIHYLRRMRTDEDIVKLFEHNYKFFRFYGDPMARL